ncbi:S2-RNase [Pyrus ussuriensis x Pyrus communis]|uniref:S2-RNase n=1 Tax=Pyrus ussuriensis x Pyrus communis TaxID=2448454 RepID=A0A5N5GTM0_9ROSA|nr:S2-RNase [Pyrus ussuriensis x Pyrus communis]
MAFHKQFYRVEPEMTINDLVEVKQYEHEFTEDFMMRFRKTRMRCQFPINHAQLIVIACKALRLPMKKTFYDVQFNELQELVIVATKYEKLLAKEQQVKHLSKVPIFYKSKASIHQLEFEGLDKGENDNSLGEGIKLCAVEMITSFIPLMLKRLVQPIKDQKIVMNDEGFVPMEPPKYQSYSFDLTKAIDIYDELVKARVILLDSTKKMPKPNELRGKKYCKLHYTFNHSIANCKLLLEKPQANMMVDTNPFPEALINMINFNWCPCECELEVPAFGAIIDRELTNTETTKNVFQRLGGDSEPKGLFEVFRNFKASEEVEDKGVRLPR